jgi:hypothetical protein
VTILLVVVRSACRSENAAKLDCEVLRKECARESPRVQERSWCAICLRAAVQSAKPIRWLSSMSQVRFVELMVRVAPVQYVKMSSEYGLIHTATSKSNVKWFIGKVKQSCKYNTFGQQDAEEGGEVNNKVARGLERGNKGTKLSIQPWRSPSHSWFRTPCATSEAV